MKTTRTRDNGRDRLVWLSEKAALDRAYDKIDELMQDVEDLKDAVKELQEKPDQKRR